MVISFPKFWRRSAPAPVATVPVVQVDQLPTPVAYAGQQQLSNWETSFYDGGKFLGGFGLTQLQIVDYWTLRARSHQLFTENLYARGLVRRLVTNEIGTGLTPEARPDEEIIGAERDSLLDWSESVENRFAIWGESPQVCDWREQSTFGAIQEQARLEAIVGGDVLRVTRRDRTTELPQIQLIAGDQIVNPLVPPEGKDIRHGVELDSRGRHVAYWIRQEDGGIKRLPAFGRRSKRRIAQLIYGTDKRYDEVRGQPLLGIVLQSLKEIDRYRDAAARKAVVNSILAMYIKKTEDKFGTLPTSGGAVRHDTATTTDSSGAPRSFNIASQIPGVVYEELQQGEEPVGFNSQGTDINFAAFEEAIIQSVAWANEVPPEILTLSFSSNYSASQAAINEFKMYLEKIWRRWGENFCTPVYVDWLLSEVRLQRLAAPGLLQAWRDPMQYDKFGAWTTVVWYGSIKPSTDMSKQAKASEILVANGWSTNARESRMLTGTKFSKNSIILRRENEQKVAANEPLRAAETQQLIASRPKPETSVESNE